MIPSDEPEEIGKKIQEDGWVERLVQLLQAALEAQETRIEGDILAWLRAEYQDAVSNPLRVFGLDYNGRINVREDWDAGRPTFESFDEFVKYPSGHQNVEGNYLDVAQALGEYLEDHIYGVAIGLAQKMNLDDVPDEWWPLRNLWLEGFDDFATEINFDEVRGNP
jgi:hypothetical protein